MKGLLLMIATVFATTPLHAKDYWEPYSVICNDNVAEIQMFYADQGLFPVMAGGGHIPDPDGPPLVKVVTYILQDDNGGFVVMRYDEQGSICLIAVGGQVTTDATLMMEWLGIE